MKRIRLSGKFNEYTSKTKLSRLRIKASSFFPLSRSPSLYISLFLFPFSHFQFQINFYSSSSSSSKRGSNNNKILNSAFKLLETIPTRDPQVVDPNNASLKASRRAPLFPGVGVELNLAQVSFRSGSEA